MRTHKFHEVEPPLMLDTTRNRYVFLSDAAAFLALPVLGFAIRFEGFVWTAADTKTLLLYTLISVPLKLAALWSFGLYNRLWRQVGSRDLLNLLLALTITAVALTLVGAVVMPGTGLTSVRVPLSVLAFDALASLGIALVPRLLDKILESHRETTQSRADDRPTLIVGAGSAGEIVGKELLSNPALGLKLVGFVDGSPHKKGMLLCGRPILGARSDIPAILAAHGIVELIIAMPEVRGDLVRELLEMARVAGVHTRIIPGLFEIISEQVSVSKLREIEIQDLLHRDPVFTDLEGAKQWIAGATVLVTGAGGSIGSELCRQVARLEPARLLLLGHGENSIFHVQVSLTDSYPDLEIVPLIADVRDRRQMQILLQQYRPKVVFHAAAHKHVPLMEANVSEAVLNNVLGTLSVANAAIAAGVEHFVLISTDKAVRPCSVMGLTKRIAEMVIQQSGLVHERDFVAVRFGNVLGSRGSVLPLFLRQIRNGGPVTVTHPDMRRYFMTIPEAVQLVLQAGALGHCGNVFVLDMGEPVRIVDLATDLIRLSGLEPGIDVKITFTGMRPGERLAEEILFAGESVTPTQHPKVLRATNGELPSRLGEMVRDLIAAAEDRRSDDVLRAKMLEMVSDAVLPAAPALSASDAVPRPEHVAKRQQFVPLSFQGNA